MAYYRTCPHCGANLDPGERCDCLEAQRDWAKSLIARLTPQDRAELWEEINAPASVTSTDGDGVDQISTSVSASNDSRNAEDLQV